MNTLKEILLALFAVKDEEKKSLTDADRDKIAEFIGVDLVDDSDADVQLSTMKGKLEFAEQKNTVLMGEVNDLKVELSTFKADVAKERKTEVIEKALSEGKFPPKQREMYEAMFDKDPEGMEKFLAEKGAEIDLTEHGNGHTPTELDDSDEAGFKVFAGMHPELAEKEAREEYVKYSQGSDQ